MLSGEYLELFTAFLTSCAAEQSQSYCGAGDGSGGAVRRWIGYGGDRSGRVSI